MIGDQVVAQVAMASASQADAALESRRARLSRLAGSAPGETRRPGGDPGGHPARGTGSAWRPCRALETAKPWQEADLDVAEAVDFCRYYARRALVELAPIVQGKDPGEQNTLHYQGRGPTVVIAPWNFPLAILCGMAVAALTAGNPVVMKPAEQSSAMAYQLFQAMREAGYPPGAVQFLPGSGEEAGRAPGGPSRHRPGGLHRQPPGRHPSSSGRPPRSGRGRPA